jgi:mono/diheme cytochrome c family protein
MKIFRRSAAKGSPAHPMAPLSESAFSKCSEKCTAMAAYIQSLRQKYKISWGREALLAMRFAAAGLFVLCVVVGPARSEENPEGDSGANLANKKYCAICHVVVKIPRPGYTTVDEIMGILNSPKHEREKTIEGMQLPPLFPEQKLRVSSYVLSAYAGLDVANKNCKSCHVVEQDEPYTGISPPPGRSFQSIARRELPYTAESIKKILETAHRSYYSPGGMPNPHLFQEDQMQQLTDYLLTLRDPHVDEGWKLAQQNCANCHVVGSDQPYTGTLSLPGPSFRSIAQRLNSSAKEIKASLMKPHGGRELNSWGMPAQKLSEIRMEKVIAYLFSLRDNP